MLLKEKAEEIPGHDVRRRSLLIAGTGKSYGFERPPNKGGKTMYDIAVIGAGPAGVSAAIYGASRGKTVLVV